MTRGYLTCQKPVQSGFASVQMCIRDSHITDRTFLAVIEHIYRAAYHVLCDLGNRRIMIFVGEGADHRTIADYRNAIRDRCV